MFALLCSLQTMNYTLNKNNHIKDIKFVNVGVLTVNMSIIRRKKSVQYWNKISRCPLSCHSHQHHHEALKNNKSNLPMDMDGYGLNCLDTANIKFRY